MKRVVVISDMHCGHRAGLTPPKWQYGDGTGDDERSGFAHNQRILWDWFTEKIDALRPIDCLFVNGDAIDGKGLRSGGTEQLEADRSKQAEMAAEVIDYIGADKIVMTYGTPYHTGQEEDWERVVSDRVNAEKIGGHEWPEVNGVIFDLKHKIGSSTIPHGRFTALARDALWNELWAIRKGQPKARVLIRSHVHYYVAIDTPQMVGMITPALQGWGSKYGVRSCSGLVDIGFIHFDVEEDGNFTWTKHILNPGQAPEMILPL